MVVVVSQGNGQSSLGTYFQRLFVRLSYTIHGMYGDPRT